MYRFLIFVAMLTLALTRPLRALREFERLESAEVDQQ